MSVRVMNYMNVLNYKQKVIWPYLSLREQKEATGFGGRPTDNIV
jgi:hypothetical protein